MRVTSFEVENFRNLNNFSMEAGSGANIIYGDNAQGKTNLLEAIWLFSGSRSFRGTKEKDYLKQGEEISTLQLSFFAEQREQTATMRFGKEKRFLSLNEIKKDSFSAFSGIFCTVIFSPDHLSLVKSGPEQRRQMIDFSLSQAFPKYTKALDNYNKALRQRNFLLKDIVHHPSLLDLLESWDKHIIDYGGYISAIRGGYIKQLAEYASEIYQGISQGKEKLKISYSPSFGTAEYGMKLEDYREAIRQELILRRAEEFKLGSTVVGPHRDDLNIIIDDKSARTFGSQGQQRSCILALKLGECEILQKRNQEPPVVMLDDVMSELDHSRRSYLLNQLQDKQVFITCCDTEAFREMKHGTVFHMEQGSLEKEKG